MAVSGGDPQRLIAKPVSAINFDSDCTVQQLKLPPSQSFLRLNYRRVIGFILGAVERIPGLERERDSLNLASLDHLIDELRASFDSICDQDYHDFVKQCDLDNYSAKMNRASRNSARHFEPSLVLDWALIETNKYCLTRKLAPDNMTTNLFLTVLKQELGRPIKYENLICRLTLLRFLQFLDKLIHDRISDSSHRKYTLVVDKNVELFIDANRDILESWFFKNRQVSARTALALGDAAECWRCISLRLWHDMAMKYSTASQYKQHCSDSAERRISISQTLLSLDSNQWQTNLGMFALCAKELGDIDLLHGMKSLVEFSGLLGDSWPLVDLMASNMNYNFGKTYAHFLELVRADADPSNVDQLCLIEFLNACIELDKLEIQSDKIAWLQSSDIRTTYEHYLASRKVGSEDLETGRRKFDQVRDWARTWSFQPETALEQLNSLRAFTSLTVSAMMNNVVRVDYDLAEKKTMVDEIRSVIKIETTSESLIELGKRSAEAEIFENKLKLILDERDSWAHQDHSTEKLIIKPTRRHQFAYRLFNDIRSRETRDHIVRQDIDMIQLSAAKFNFQNENLEYASLLAKDLSERDSVSESIKFYSRALLLKTTDDEKFPQECQDLIRSMAQSNSLNIDIATRLRSKIFCESWRRQPNNDTKRLCKVLHSIFVSHEERFETLDDTFRSSDLDRIIEAQDLPMQVLSVVARSLDESCKSSTSLDPEILNSSIRIDIALVLKAQQLNSRADKKCIIIEAVVRILDKVRKHASNIDSNNLKEFSSQPFIGCLMNHALSDLRSSIISMITYQQFLPSTWVELLTKIVKQMASMEPHSILFETLVNQFDWQVKLAGYRASPEHGLSDTSAALSHQHDTISTSGRKPSLEICQTQVKFWNEIYKELIDGKSEDWLRQVSSTEAFLREIRRISYLTGEYVNTLTMSLDRRLQQYLNVLAKQYDDPKQRDECRAKFDAIYHHESKSVEFIRNHLEQIMKDVNLTRFTMHDLEVSMFLLSQIKKLDGLLKYLAKCKNASRIKIESVVKSIIETSTFCRATATTINRGCYHKLFINQISPILSRLDPGSAIMPGYFLDSCSKARDGHPQTGIVTIYKVAPTVNMIHSKTAPKRLTFIGSDGISRSYLLKAHEDLRLDKVIMDLFGSINLSLEGDKKTRDYKYCLQRYSVTPVSSRSGLLQWIEAPSLCAYYRTWSQSPTGRRIVGSLYKETCASVCLNQGTNSEQHNCSPLGTIRTTDLFHQLLWAKIRDLPRRGAGGVQLASHHNDVARPSSETTLKYRKEFPHSIYEEVLERMVSAMPHELIVNNLWFKSPHSMDFYLRTREFIRTCATTSMVGYVIGLGDRHPDNILLDASTGRVTHIDYNVCFELGYRLSIPEQVPFRLTPNIIHAFGFAGLEGGFKRSCERILDHMKEHKSIILHHLDPVNLHFMIDVSRRGTATVGTRCSADNESIGNNEPAKVSNQSGEADDVISDLTVADKRPLVEIDSNLVLCSQEEDDSTAASLKFVEASRGDQSLDEHNITAARPKDAPLNESQRTQDLKSVNFSQTSLEQIHLDIKTPPLMSAERAKNIFQRIHNKLTGNDELLLSRMYASRARSGSASLAVKSISATDIERSDNLARDATNDDLILLTDEVLSTKDQVAALILEAISNKNKAAMFEGWSPWI